MICCFAQAHDSVVQLDVGISCVLLSSRSWFPPKRRSSPESLAVQLGCNHCTFIINKPYLLPSTCSVPGKSESLPRTVYSCWSESRLRYSELTASKVFTCLLCAKAVTSVQKNCTSSPALRRKFCTLGPTALTRFPLQFVLRASLEARKNLNAQKSFHNLLMVPLCHKTCIFQSYANPWNSKWNITENKPNTFQTQAHIFHTAV